MENNSFSELFQDQLADLYNAETQLVKALPKMAKKATSEQLREALESHLKETKNQVARLEQIGQMLDIKVTGKKCKGMEGLIEESEEAVESGDDGPVMDAGIIAAAQRVEHYEIAGYGTVREFAKCLGYDEAAELLSESLEEESNANETLTSIATAEINPEAVAME